MAFRESLHPELVLLDVEGRGTGDVFEPVARAIVEHLVRDGQMSGTDAGAALAALVSHLGRKKVLEHDAALAEHRRRKALEAAEALPKRPSRTLSFGDLFRARSTSADDVFGGSRNSLDASAHEEPREEAKRAPPPSPLKDALAPDAEEEAVHVLIDDDFEWLRADASALVRLRSSVVSGLEEHVLADGEDARTCTLRARFIVLILGPKGDVFEGRARQRHDRHVEMGAAAAALLQEDAIVKTLYEAKDGRAILDALDGRLRGLRVLPRTTRPTKRSLAAREERMVAELRDLKDQLVEAERAALLRGDSDGESTVLPAGGYVLRVAYERQDRRWDARQKDAWRHGVSLGALVDFSQKYALPLLSGIVLALVLANEARPSYDRWTGVDHGDDDADDHRRLSDGAHPSLFGLRLRRHDVTLHFVVNDVLMTLFFGLAVKEIAEAFQPGGSLYPPTRKAVNPLCGTVGGVLGPIAAYLAILAAAKAVPGLLADDFATLAKGWGIPTATDISIAWVTALCVFGAGHPAINFLLLCAIIDDGIGLVIIAVAYRESDPAVAPAYAYLLLCLAAMGVAYALRRARVAQWWVYCALAGPLAWYGLLYAAVHPSLALCFVVPFLPLDLDAHDDGGDGDDVSDDEEDAKPHRSPLHDFEHATKGFVDFGVLFAFGAVNAGVRVDGVGGYSLVVFLSLLVGKTLGMVGGSQVATLLGFPRPEGMSFRALVVDGVISSVGLTVSLFISGMAFADNARVMDQAKFGALLSLSPAVVLVCFATFVPDGRRLLLPPEAPRELEAAKRDRGAAMSPIDEEASVHHTMGGRRPPTPSVDEEEEDLEEVIVHNMEDSLHRIHRIEARCERKGGITRAASLSFINATPSNSGSNLSSLGHSSAGSLAQLSRSATPTLLTVPGSPPGSASPRTPDGASPPPLRLTANADPTPMPRTPPRR